MNRRSFMKRAGAGAIAMAAPGWLGRGTVQAADEPAGRPLNVLFIITDQQFAGALSCAGNQYVKTPNMDKLAARGVRFDKSYCTYPLCCPSRGSFFTSRMPHEVGIYGNYDAELSAKNVPTMGELFRSAGYDTAYTGKWHLNTPFPAFKGGKIPGFEVLPLAGRDPHTIDMAKDGKGLTVDPHAVDAAVKFLRQPHKKPFLLVASIVNPHDICEYVICSALRKLLPEDRSKLTPARPNLRDTEPLPSALQKMRQMRSEWTDLQWREYLWVYYRLVEIADAEVGRVLGVLDEAGLASDTVVVFTSDHGEMMGSHLLVTKSKLYEEAVAVPLIVAAPGVKAGVDRDHLVSGLDIMPTLLDYAGITAPASLLGKSLRPLVEGKAIPWRDFVASETVSGAEARMIRTARYKYIVFAAGENREQFFDMEKDSGELRNLVNDNALAAEVTRHRDLLKQWMLGTKDVLGKGKEAPKNTKKGGAAGKQRADANKAGSTK